TPPSLLQQRVLVSISANGSTGSLEILDGLRDIRSNLQNTIHSFFISGYSGGFPTTILNFPEQLRGLVYSDTSPYGVTDINYGTEAVIGSAGGFTARSTSIATAPDFLRVYSAQEGAGQLQIQDNGIPSRLYTLNLPNVYKVVVNTGDTIALAMVRNSDTLYRVLKLNNGQTNPPGAIDCQPLILPVYCVVPVNGSYDRPTDAYFSTDGTTAYILNCGVECGGGSNGGAAISIIPQDQLNILNIPSSATYPIVVSRTVPVPGGVTTALSDGSSLYMAGQQLQPDGLFAGRLSIMNLSTFAVSTPVSISDGLHTRLLFADDNTLWIGSQSCASGERAKLGQNYNCLTRYDLGTQAATIVPAITTNITTNQPSVPYPNQDNNLLYLGSLTGICWVQNYHKVYTAYGGQVHAFYTSNGAEIDNVNIAVQGTALNVAYMDALTNTAN
ncbi:MAG: hypothetical protein ACRYFU_05435, partial [Janthinobacterium lividum]